MRTVSVTLHRERVLIADFRIATESGLAFLPAISSIAGTNVTFRCIIIVFCIYTCVAIIAQLYAIPDAIIGSDHVANASRSQTALRILGSLGDDVDHAVYSVRAPLRRARPADNLDAVNIFQHSVLHFPKRARE